MISSPTEQTQARMLVVDDDPRSRKLLEGYLRAEGHEVRSACDGPEALSMAGQRPPDVVLLDVMMPGMTGYEVCKVLKDSAATRLSQVMLVTALSGIPDKVEGLDTGADDFVTKPVRREEFLAKVRALLRVRRSLVALEQARSDLAARNEELQLKKTLAQTLVHDLKNPLAAILGNLDLLDLRCESSIRHLVRRIKKGAERMLEMIMNLLDVERLEEGRLRPNREVLDAAVIAAAAVQDVKVSALQKEVRVELFAPEPTPIEGDRILVRRILDNLLANAVAHSPVAGTVAVRVRSREEGAEIEVADEGPGIPEEHRERVFDKYAQIELRRAGMSSNRGLGLTFCRLAVEAHGGTIWVESAPEGGASFRTLLPAAVPAADEPTVPASG